MSPRKESLRKCVGWCWVWWRAAVCNVVIWRIPFTWWRITAQKRNTPVLPPVRLIVLEVDGGKAFSNCSWKKKKERITWGGSWRASLCPKQWLTSPLPGDWTPITSLGSKDEFEEWTYWCLRMRPLRAITFYYFPVTGTILMWDGLSLLGRQTCDLIVNCMSKYPCRGGGGGVVPFLRLTDWLFGLLLAISNPNSTPAWLQITLTPWNRAESAIIEHRKRASHHWNEGVVLFITRP